MTESQVIFRAEFTANGKVGHFTFSKRNEWLAAEFAYTVLERLAQALDKNATITGIIPVLTPRQ